MSKPRSRQIRIKPEGSDERTLQVGGWLSGRQTYIWLGQGKDMKSAAFIGTLGGYSLYRLAKAIVRHYESDK